MAEEHDKLLPIANVGRIMKLILPPNAKVSREAKETMQECASEFICFVTGEASDRCHKEKRKTVNGDDVCWALNALGFSNYHDSMCRYLQKFREYETEKANSVKKGHKDEKRTSDFEKIRPPQRNNIGSSPSLILEMGNTSKKNKSNI